MKAMILAAGRGERMRPLTDHCPKPLLKVLGTPLIEHHIRKLASIGVKDIVINLAWLGDKIVDYLQNGQAFDVNIHYSWEKEGALETAGGIINALPKLTENDAPFIVVNGDIFFDFDFTCLPSLLPHQQAHLWLVKNPSHNLAGDFLLENGKITNKNGMDDNGNSYTFSGIGMYRPSLFLSHQNDKVLRLAPILKSAIDRKIVTAEVLQGAWTDVGTPERLASLNNTHHV